MTSTSDRGLLAKSLSGLKWNYLGIAARIAIQLVAQISIARLVGPAHFGSATAAVFVFSLCCLVVELGLSSSLVQMKEISAEHVRFAFRRIFIASFLAFALIQGFAGIIADFWKNPEVGEFLRILAIGLIVQAPIFVYQGILKRNLDFRAIQIAQISSYFIGFVIVGISLAYFNFGGWSLIGAWMAQGLCLAILLKIQSNYLPIAGKGVVIHHAQMTRQAMQMLGTNIFNWAVENIDNLLVGRFFGTTALGNYSVAYNLARTPCNHLVVSLQQVIFPAVSRANADAEKAVYLVLTWTLSLIVFPLFFSLAALSGSVIDLLYGKQWTDAANLLMPLAIAMPFHALMAIAGPILWGRGQAKLEMPIQAATALVFIGVLTVLSSISVVAMAWGVVAVYIFRYLWITLKLAKATDIPLTKIIPTVGPNVGYGLVFLFSIAGASELFSKQSDTSFWMLALAATLAIQSVLVLVTLRYTIPKEVSEIIQNIDRIPEAIKKLLRRKP